MIARAVLALVVVTSLASANEPEPASSLVASANAAFTELRYVDALALLDRAWRRGGSSPEQLRAIFSLAGQAAGSTGDAESARLWFRRWLCLEPEAALAPGTSPKLTALLRDARDVLAGSSLDARAIRHGATVEITLASDPLALVDAVHIGAIRTAIHGTMSVTDPSSTVDLVDRYGNVLATVAVTEVAVRQEEVRVHASPQPVPWFARWTTWAIASGGFAVVAGGSLAVAVDARSKIRDLNRASSSHEFSEAASLESRFDRAQLVADVAIGGAVVSVVIAGVLWMRGSNEPIAIVPAANGASVVWSSSF